MIQVFALCAMFALSAYIYYVRRSLWTAYMFGWHTSIMIAGIMLYLAKMWTS